MKQLLLRTITGSILLSILLTTSQAQQLRVPLSATAPFVAAYSAKEADVFSFAANQAALANITSASVGFYAEKRFLLQELSFYGLALALPTSSGQFGLTARYLGHSAYNEASAGLAYGRKLSALVDIGAQFTYHTQKAAAQGTASAVYAEAAALFHLSKQVHAGLQVSNPTSVRLGKEGGEQLPFMYTAGVGYEVSDRFFVGGELQKRQGAALGVNAGMQYRFDNRLWARTGFRSVTDSYYLALGAGLKFAKLEAMACVHPQLGITPALQLVFTSKEKTP